VHLFVDPWVSGTRSSGYNGPIKVEFTKPHPYDFSAVVLEGLSQLLVLLAEADCNAGVAVEQAVEDQGDHLYYRATCTGARLILFCPESVPGKDMFGEIPKFPPA